MSRNADRESTPPRRKFLQFLGVASAISSAQLFAGATSTAEAHGHVAVTTASRRTTDRKPRSAKTSQTAAALRALWVDHIFWVRNVSIATLDKNDVAAKAAEQQAVANAQAIAATVEPFYGAAARESFFKLLASHYTAVKDYLVATATADTAAQGKATQSLTSNAEEIAVFLSKANPYLPKDALSGLLLAHGGHHIQQIQQLKDRKYESEAQTWKDMKDHVYQIADTTADALAKQFAKRF